MKKLKDLCLGVLIKEGEEAFSLSPEEVGNVVDIKFIDDDIKIDFKTTYGKSANLVAKLEDLKSWSINNSRVQSFSMMSPGMFRLFVVDFIKNSTEGEDSLNEIIDDDLNIIGDDDMPTNSTNSMVTSPKFDLEKIFKSFIPKSTKFYSGSMGIGAIAW